MSGHFIRANIHLCALLCKHPRHVLAVGGADSQTNVDRNQARLFLFTEAGRLGWDKTEEKNNPLIISLKSAKRSVKKALPAGKLSGINGSLMFLFESLMIGFESMMIGFESMLIGFESMMIGFERLMIGFEW